mgnify:FL=1|tara:strand:+ start:520 stop:1746 length:1227 start_codon:yes stop_codon:yes gene_type:complete
MKKTLLLLVTLLFAFSSTAQEKEKGKFFKSLYKDFLKYGTVYAAGDIRSPYESERRDYFVERPADGDLYAIPRVIDVTEYFDFDYRWSVGIRKLARFSYERKPRNWYDGTEQQLAFTAPSSALTGLEYQFDIGKERNRGEIFDNHRFFVKWTGKYHIIKAESRQVGKINLDYKSAEVRARLPIGKKFSISAGAIFRTHERAYGYNPIEIWLNETETWTNPTTGEVIEYPANPWYALGFEYGYSDHYTTYTDVNTGDVINDWIWRDEDGNIVAYSDLDFRNTVFRDLINRYNNEQWDLIDAFAEVAPIVGFDYYHYQNNFWLHAYANYILPYHKYVKGDVDFSYLNRNNWGKGGLIQDAELEQWDDYSAGVNFGWKLSKQLGVFFEGEYTKLWDSELFQGSVGLNFSFK